MECIITEHGVCQIPALKAPPVFQLDDQFAKAAFFVVESADAKGQPTSRKLDRSQLESLTATRESAVLVDHDE